MDMDLISADFLVDFLMAIIARDNIRQIGLPP
jgi:hypothetical protein